MHTYMHTCMHVHIVYVCNYMDLSVVCMYNVYRYLCAVGIYVHVCSCIPVLIDVLGGSMCCYVLV